MRILMPALASASNIIAATPGFDAIPAPTMETLATPVLMETSSKSSPSLFWLRICPTSSALSSGMVKEMDLNRPLETNRLQNDINIDFVLCQQ